MEISVTKTTGSGSFATVAPENYSYSEDVTSLNPYELDGGAGQVSVTAPSNLLDKDGATHPNSALMINNEMILKDDLYGEVSFQVRQVSVSDGMASVTGNTIMWRLNVEKTAPPHGGLGATLFTAIQTYCNLVDVTPVVSAELQAELDAIPVNFVGWRGNVWEHLKMLCAGISLSATDNIGLEMYVDGADLVFRKAKQETVIFNKGHISQDLQVDVFETAKVVNLFNYNTTYGLDRIVQEQNPVNPVYAVNENVSITDTLQVDAGQTIVKRFQINASLESVNQPVAVSAITQLPYQGTVGEYVIVGSDDLPIMPAQWIAQGGSLTVALTENPSEIEITITAPPAVTLPHADDADLGYAPYKIGVESSGDADYPALYIVGTGVFFKKTEHQFFTGASDSFTPQDSVTSIDNPFITNRKDLSIRGVAAAQAVCGPKVTLSEERFGEISFGSTIGQMFEAKSNKFRISSISHSASSSSITAKPCASFADFDMLWSGKTFNDFKSIALDPVTYPDDTLKFNEFTIIPLMESA